MATFTCITCQVIFPDSEIQREHYKTDWHRYNLKRKVADLPPVTVENFHARVLAHKNLQDTKSEETDVCRECRKHFNNKRSFENHLRSKKHQETVKKLQQSVDSNYIIKDYGSIGKGEKNNQNNELVKSLNQKNAQTSHVANKSSKRLTSCNSNESDELVESDDDEWEDVEDEDELEIGVEDCLFCSEHSETMEENIKHMTTTHSFFIPDVEYLTDVERLLSYLGEKLTSGKLCLWCNEKGKAFQSAKAAQQHMLDKGHCKMLYEGDALLEYVDFYDYSSSYPDHDEATNIDEEIVPDVLSEDDYQLVLPSGATIGHRSLVRYYKQNIPPKRKVETKSQKMVQHVLSHYRALGYSEATHEVTAKRVRDVRYLQSIQAKNRMKQGVRNNNLQQHFRLQYRY